MLGVRVILHGSVKSYIYESPGGTWYILVQAVPHLVWSGANCDEGRVTPYLMYSVEPENVEIIDFSSFSIGVREIERGHNC